MSVQAAGETRCGIGTRLRAGRERKGFTVLQAAEKMHVDPKILESLESEDFDALGAPVYARGHLRHYAELVGEQSSELQSLYANSIRVAPPDLTRVPKVEAPSDPRRLTVPATAVLLTFAIAGGVWWVVTLPKGHPHLTSTPAASTMSAPRPTAATQGEAPAPPAQSGEPLAAEAPRVGGGSRATPNPTRAAAAAAGSAAAAAETHKASTGVVAPSAANTSAAPGEAAAGTGSARPGRQAQLTLRFTSESWAEVYDSKGERLFYDVGPADSVRTFKGTPPLRVVLGNAPGVAVEVNGRVASLANLTHTDGTAQFVVSRAGRVSPSPSPSP
jgi:cytoskeleton protein RodZ